MPCLSGHRKKNADFLKSAKSLQLINEKDPKSPQVTQGCKGVLPIPNLHRIADAATEGGPIAHQAPDSRRKMAVSLLIKLHNIYIIT